MKVTENSQNVNALAHIDDVYQRLRKDLATQLEQTTRLGHIDAFDAETRITASVMELGCAAMSGFLGALLPDTTEVVVDGVRFKRLNQETVGWYRTLFGPVSVVRPLFRSAEIRNGPSVDIVALRANLIDDFTPKAAFAISRAVQSAPAREAAQICEGMGILPYSRSTFQRVPLRVGAIWDSVIEEVLPEISFSDEVLNRAVAVVAEVDRVSIPMAEPREPTELDRARGTVRPIHVTLRMSFCGALVLLDEEGTVLDTLRYAHIPEGGNDALVSRMKTDVDALLDRRSSLKIATIADGAKDMQAMLERITAGHEVVSRLVDIWHLLGYLRKAGKALGIDTEAMIAGIFENEHGIDDIEAWLANEKRKGGENVHEDVENAAKYVDNRPHLVDYYRARENGVPIGSGHIEATCKTIVSVRFKRAGARWSADGAQHLLVLRALSTSGNRWEPALRRMLEVTAPDIQLAA